MSKGRTFTTQEVVEFVESVKKKQPYKMRGHSFYHLKGAGKHCCSNCGLVALNNKFTEWCIDKGCNHEDHPQYLSTMRRLTRDKRLK